MADEVNQNSQIEISDDAIRALASIAACELPGVARLESDVAVSRSTSIIKIDLEVYAVYGYKLPDLAFNIQENVKNSLCEQLELDDIEVNVHFLGISFI